MPVFALMLFLASVMSGVGLHDAFSDLLPAAEVRQSLLLQRFATICREGLEYVNRYGLVPDDGYLDGLSWLKSSGAQFGLWEGSAASNTVVECWLSWSDLTQADQGLNMLTAGLGSVGFSVDGLSVGFLGQMNSLPLLHAVPKGSFVFVSAIH
jgi:hypothetical protein